jgi:hypothetical protein
MACRLGSLALDNPSSWQEPLLLGTVGRCGKAGGAARQVVRQGRWCGSLFSFVKFAIPST